MQETHRMPERNDETGQYTASYPLERFTDALRELDGGATTQEVREAVGCAYRTAHARLSELEADGRVSSRSVGRAKLWRVAKGADGRAERSDADGDHDATDDDGAQEGETGEVMQPVTTRPPPEPYDADTGP
jgi:hypothetical protein